MPLFPRCNLNPCDAEEGLKLLREIAHNLQELKTNMANLKDQLTGVSGTLDTLNTNFTTFKSDVDRLIADFQANNPNDPAVQQLITDIQTKIGTLGTSIGAEDANVNTADPGQAAPSNTPGTPAKS